MESPSRAIGFGLIQDKPPPNRLVHAAGGIPPHDWIMEGKPSSMGGTAQPDADRPDVPAGSLFDASQLRWIETLNQVLFEAFHSVSGKAVQDRALRHYLDTMTMMASRYRMFEIANHRMFRAGDALIVPYDAQGRLSIHVVRQAGQHVVRQLRVPPGNNGLSSRKASNTTGELSTFGRLGLS